MGANLCCFKRACNSEQVRAAADVPTSRNYQIVPHRDYSTLKEHFLASPIVKVHAYKSSPEASVFHTPRVSLSSPDLHAVNAGFFSPRLSFSSDKLGKIEEIDDEKELLCSRSAMMNRSRSGSGKFKKKVTFKLPENADVIVFCTPQDSFEEL